MPIKIRQIVGWGLLNQTFFFRNGKNHLYGRRILIESVTAGYVFLWHQ